LQNRLYYKNSKSDKLTQQNTKMKNITLLLLASLISIQSAFAGGWGENQGKGTVKGVILGGTLGGVVGHQHGKQKEGIIIGTILGGLMGNRIGKGTDSEYERQRQEEIRKEQAWRAELQRKEEERVRIAQEQKRQRYLSNLPVHTNNTNFGGANPTDELVLARQRAEQREQELQREIERQRIAEQRRQALESYIERERRAQEELNRIRGASSSNHYQ
jgi:outer membrane lipoprotein SlyB